LSIIAAMALRYECPKIETLYMSWTIDLITSDDSTLICINNGAENKLCGNSIDEIQIFT